MNQKEKTIIETAMKFFSDKGYYATSVQEIAEECSISKGSLYKYFPSKEDLFIGACSHSQQEMFEKATFVHMKETTSPKEWLTKQLTIQLEEFVSKRDFFILQFKEMPLQDNEKMISLKQQLKSRIMSWQRDSLLKAYGVSIEPFIWDIVVMMQGMMKEYMMLLILSQQEKPMEQLAFFIVDRVDGMISEMKKSQPKPFMTSQDLAPVFGEKQEPHSGEETLSMLIDSMKTIVEKLPKDKRQSYLSSVLLLEEEWNKQEPRRFLLQALLSYIEKEHLLKFYVQKANWLLEGTNKEEASWNI
ncbi:TetR/AcrR family transcriptional regulator [Bacillus sp. 2205SS5-2]|uniref:TetR/AcrR family transcriptional regulator n=1 Tax=Bacillus sp. 2205SS5-2 TaxID=3109031 RepID=UPI00300555FC